MIKLHFSEKIIEGRNKQKVELSKVKRQITVDNVKEIEMGWDKETDEQIIVFHLKKRIIK